MGENQDSHEALKGEVEMLDKMIEEVEDQLSAVGQNLFKLRAVRNALSKVIAEQPELDLGL